MSLVLNRYLDSCVQHLQILDSCFEEFSIIICYVSKRVGMTDISTLLENATALAKDKKFDEAIGLLVNLVPSMANQGGFSHAQYTKVIPYFQKAGRYSEVESYCEDVLIGAVKSDCDKTFGHQPKETKEAFINLYASKIYDKLRLCAQRENLSDEVKRFRALQQRHYSKYEAWFEKEHGYIAET